MFKKKQEVKENKVKSERVVTYRNGIVESDVTVLSKLRDNFYSFRLELETKEVKDVIEALTKALETQIK